MADDEAWLDEVTSGLRVKPGTVVDLDRDFDPRHHPEGLDKDGSAGLLERSVELLAGFQRRLAAQDAYGVLVVLQGIDGSGKDGIVRHVLSGLNPQGVNVSSFKVPSAEELDHDYLWRYARRLPARGQIGIFNRSHYEEVIVVRVHPDYLDRQKLPAEAKDEGVWLRRYRDLNAWERHLVENGFVVVKLFLNLSKEEQRERFLRRIDLPDHNWKFSAADVAERDHWDAYRQAYAQMLSHTSTEWAPWWVIPADRKWFARLAAAAVITKALIAIDPRFPRLGPQERQALAAAREKLVAEE